MGQADSPVRTDLDGSGLGTAHDVLGGSETVECENSRSLFTAPTQTNAMGFSAFKSRRLI